MGAMLTHGRCLGAALGVERDCGDGALLRRDHLWRSDPRIQHWESFEVLRDGKRNKFLFDTSAFRRGISGRMSKDEAKQQALAFAQCTEDRIEIDPDEAAPPPWAE